MRQGDKAADWTYFALAGRGLGIELLRAHFTAHAYDRHSHDTYAIGVTEAGAQAFNCRGAHHVSTAQRIMAFNPDEAHDGHACDAGGFTYRMLYIPPALVARTVADASGAEEPSLPFAREPIIDDPTLARLVLALHAALEEGEDRLECEALCDALIARFAARHAAPRRYLREQRPSMTALQRVRDYLHETPLGDELAADELARIAGMSRFHLWRAFRAAYGLPPHAYRLQRRLAAAKAMLASGERPAAVAASLGFADQSHFHRRFKGAYGVTPGEFAAAAQRTDWTHS